MSDPSNQKGSVANGVATAVLIWAILYDLFAYTPWRVAVILGIAVVAALVVLFRPPQDFAKEKRRH